jgi:DNA (cytosine-5)-methyltransferase 1
LNVLDLFSGIGGFSLGLEWAGFRTVAFCESDVDASTLLARRWPGRPVFGDIRTITVEPGFADVFVGGFPCQPFSTASRGRASAEDLWPEFVRLVGEGHPRWVAAENVPGIGHEGIERVCSDLESEGYTVWTFDLDTALPQRQRGRHRIIWLAHADSESEPRCTEHAEMAGLPSLPKLRQAHDPTPMGMDDELPGRMVQLRQLGNAITPDIAYLIGRAIMRAEHGK